MKIHSNRVAVLGMQWVLGLTVLIEAAFLAFAPAQIHSFDKTGLPDWVRLVVAWGEMAGAVLFLVPRTVVVGSLFLCVIFIGGAAIHLIHGHGNVSMLIVYAAAAWVVAANAVGPEMNL